MARTSPNASPSHRRRRPPARRKARPRAPGWRLLAASLGVFCLVFLGGLVWPLANLPFPAPNPGATEGPAVQVVRVIDGDTLDLANGERIRILNIDTAEMPPKARCPEERDLALAAKARLATVLRQGEVITLAAQGRDRDAYGRQLRLVRVDGQDVGELLVREGLAQPWRGRKATWC